MYGLEDLKFGQLPFIVLTGILLCDLYPDPDVVCQFLNGDQLHGVTWFYEWILKSLEGVEVHEMDARAALTRSQMICPLRYSEDCSKLSKIPSHWIILWSRMVGSWPSITFRGCRFVQARICFMDQLRMIQRARIMWNKNLVIQRLSDEKFSVTYRIPDESLSQELWISWVPEAVGSLRPQTLQGELYPRFKSPGTVAKRCKTIRRPQQDCILEWARLNPEKISQLLERLESEPKWQMAFRSLYDSLHLRLYNKDSRTVELMELQLNYRVEQLCLEFGKPTQWLFRSGHPGGKLTRRDLGQIVRMVLLPRENIPQGGW